MKVILEGDPKEIADFVLELQNKINPQVTNNNSFSNSNDVAGFVDALTKGISESRQVMVEPIKSECDLIGKPVEISKIEDINAFIETARLDHVNQSVPQITNHNSLGGSEDLKYLMDKAIADRVAKCDMRVECK